MTKMAAPKRVVERKDSLDAPVPTTAPGSSLDNDSSFVQYELLTFSDKNLADGDDTDIVVIDNHANPDANFYDKNSKEEIIFLMAVITPKHTADKDMSGHLDGHEVFGDRRLATLTKDLEKAGLHTHTYDARSGNEVRITRIGATQTRLKQYASAAGYIDEFNEEKLESYCINDIKVEIKNPKRARYYRPYQKLSGPFSLKHENLFNDFTNGDYLYLLIEILQAPKRVPGLLNIPKGRLYDLPEDYQQQETHPKRGCALDIGQLNNYDPAILSLFPLHDNQEKALLRKELLDSIWPWNMPLNRLSEYFGKEVAFYFSFLSILTSGFMFLSVPALVAQILAYLGFHEWTFLLSAVLGVCAYGAVMDAWKCEQSKVCHLWGCIDGFKANNTPRKAYVDASLIVRNSGTGELDIEFPPTKRERSLLISNFVTGVFVLFMLGIVGLIFGWKATLVRQTADETEDGTASMSTTILLLLPSVANAAQVTILASVYQYVAEYLTEIENHETVAEHNSELFRKLTLFYFINYNAALFYIAFIKEHVEDAGCYDHLTGLNDCGRELGTQVLVLYLCNDFGWRMCTSIIIPALMKIVIARTNDLDESKMCSVELDTIKMSYDPTTNLVLDYIELFVQWSYITLFGSAFPGLIPLAFITNLIECRTDCLKLIDHFRRVIPRRINGIGEATNIFYMTLNVAVLINAGLVVYTYGLADHWAGKENRSYVWFILVLFLFYALQQMTLVFPEMPEKTFIQMQRQSFVHEYIVENFDPMPDEYGEKRMKHDLGTRKFRSSGEDFKRLYDEQEAKDEHGTEKISDLFKVEYIDTDEVF